MVPLSEIISRVRTRYEAESGGSSVRHTDANITQSINEGLETLAEETGFYERYVTIPVAELRTYYDIRGFTPEIVTSISSVWSSARNDWLTPISVQSLDPSWEDSVGTPHAFFTRGTDWLGLFPKADSGTGIIRVYFTGIPSRFTHPQAVLGDLPDDHVHALEDYAMYEMAAQDRRGQHALLLWSSYQKREKALRTFVERRAVAARTGRIGGLAGRIGD